MADDIFAQLVYGATAFDLTRVTDEDVSAPRMGGIGRASFKPHQLEHAAALEDMLFTERWSLVMRARKTDRLADRIRKLIRILRAAWQFQGSQYQTTQVYLKARATRESNFRYAIVHSSPEISGPTPMFDAAMDQVGIIEELGVSISRYCWRATQPGTLPTITTLNKSSGPIDTTMVHVGNSRETAPITHIFRLDDSTGVFSANLAGTTGFALFPAATAVDDALFIGATGGPLRTAVIPIGTPGVMNATALVQIWTGAAFVTLVAGTEYTIYPSSAGTDTFTTAEQWVINIFGKAGWNNNPINAVNAYWIKIKLNPFVAMGTIPVSSATITPYAQRDPHVAIPAAALKGDIPTMMLLRLGHPAGGLSTACPGITSRIIIGAKARGLTNFVSHLNLGNAGNPAGWATAYGTDTAAGFLMIAPMALDALCTFATDTSQVVRVTLTGTNMMPDWEGRYRVFVLAIQNGGAAGDCSVMVRARMIDTSTYRTKFDTPTVATKAASSSYWEALDLGTIRLPLVEETGYDPLTCNLLFQILASRAGGAATLAIGALILIPIDEWAATLDDPVSDAVTGPSALRGGTLLYVDGGIIQTRAAKHQRIGAVDTLMEPWYRDGNPPMLEPAKATRLYFLMLHYPTTFGAGPMLVALGQHLTVELFTVARYLYLRGDD